MTEGFIVFAHGSRIESANQGVRELAAEFARAAGGVPVEPAFLELGEPDLAGAAALLMGRGVRRIVVIPYFLTLGIHLERDLPQLVGAIQAANPGLQIELRPPLEGHPALLQILLDRSKEAI